MSTIKLSNFNFETLTLSVITEGLTHLKNHIEDTETKDYLCDLASESLQGMPYIVYHSKAKNWLKIHNLEVFEVIEEIREYHINNFGDFTLEVNPENMVTAYMEVVLSDLVGIWLVDRLEKDHDIYLWDEELNEDTRSIILDIISKELDNCDDE